MRNKSFFIGVIGASFISLAASSFFNPLQSWVPYYSSYICVILFFIIFSIVLFLLGKRSARSKNLYLFNQIFIASIMFKMVIFFSIVIILVKVVQLDQYKILVPLLITYLSFTIFETYFLMKISKT
ncbi:MAG: hypothetical protein M3Q56_12605 [Bacteroidota bacterium]|nr:hypothetical protein [Bacteroidota bacterium]